MIAEIITIALAVNILWNIIYQLFAGESWLQRKRFEARLNVIRLEGPVSVLVNGKHFVVNVKQPNIESCKINICGYYSNMLLCINDEPMCMIHRIYDLSSMFMRRSVEYNDHYSINEIDHIIDVAYDTAKKERDIRYKHYSEDCKRSLYDKKERGEQE